MTDEKLGRALYDAIAKNFHVYLGDFEGGVAVIIDGQIDLRKVARAFLDAVLKEMPEQYPPNEGLTDR
jgi:hypothetical protein